MVWFVRGMLVLFLMGCQTAPIVDQAGVDPGRYQADLNEYQYYAGQVNSARAVASKGALTGLFGGLLV